MFSKFYFGILLLVSFSISQNVNLIKKNPEFIQNWIFINKNRNKKSLYYTLIYSRIKYGLSVYGHAGVTKLNKIQFLQNQLLKVLSNKKFRHSTAENQMIHFLFLIIFQIFFNDLEFWIIYSFLIIWKFSTVLKIWNFWYLKI